MQREKKGRGRLVVLAAFVGIVLIVGVVELLNTESGSHAASGGASDEVGALFANHLNSLQLMNFSAIQGQYAQDATAEFYSPGDGSGAGGHESVNASGPSQIVKVFSGVLLADFGSPGITDDNYTVSIVGNVAAIHAALSVDGENLNGAGVAASVDLHMTYLRAGGSWLISHELWNFTQVISQG